MDKWKDLDKDTQQHAKINQPLLNNGYQYKSVFNIKSDVHVQSFSYSNNKSII